MSIWDRPPVDYKRAYHQMWWAANRERVKATRAARAAAHRASPPREDGEKACGGCGETQPLTSYTIDRERSDGRGTYCRACASLRRAARKEAQS